MRAVPRFPRGFLLSTRPAPAPPEFVRGPVLENFHVHPWTKVEHAGDRGLFVIVLGHCVSIEDTDTRTVSEQLLAALRHGVPEFLARTDYYGGRYAIIFGSEDHIRVVNDATSMRSVFYTRDGSVIASHALLAERSYADDVVESDLPYRYGYPGNLTPYPRTKVLTANTYYCLKSNRVRRFWPVARPAPRSSVQAAAKVLHASSHIIRRLARDKDVALTLTAGLDSRAVMAMAVHAGVDFRTYTYGADSDTEVDRRIAALLADQFDIAHTVVEHEVHTPTLATRLREINYSTHHGKWVGALSNHFDPMSTLTLLGNLFEIGRSNFAPAREGGARPPVDAESMALLHYRKFGATVRDWVETYGLKKFMDYSIDAFQSHIDDTGFSETVGIIDPFDQFYWEHRMAAWQGVAMGERDFYSDPIIPFNARYLFEVMLGVNREERYSDLTPIRLIQQAEPALLDIPINPPSVSEFAAAST